MRCFPPAQRRCWASERIRTGEDAGLDKAEAGKRIAHPDFFPVYFHCEVPETLFSSREMERFIDSLKQKLRHGTPDSFRTQVRVAGRWIGSPL